MDNDINTDTTDDEQEEQEEQEELEEEFYSTEDSGASSQDNKIKIKKKFTSKEILFLKSIHTFFKTIPQNKMKYMYDIINSSANISLRLLDWFVTRYAKKHKISYYHEQEQEEFIIHLGYKSQLKSYKKRYFDPFRRNMKFYYMYDFSDSCKKLLTTIGQLNFFRWAFYYKVIDYVEANYQVIDQCMTKTNKDDKLKKKPEKNNIKKKKSKIQINNNSILTFE
jgi:hypothetical protein